MRHKAREIALQGLYQLEIHKTAELDLIDAFLARTRQDEWEHFRSRLKEDTVSYTHLTLPTRSEG